MTPMVDQLSRRSCGHFLALPEEVRIRILQELSAADLLACQKVCRSLRATALDPYLQHVAALDVAGMQDGPSAGAPLPERSKALADYEATWETGQVPYRYHSVHCQVYHLCHWSGGVFVHCPPPRGPARLLIYRPASFFGGIPEKTWSIDLSAFVYDTEGIESLQDIVTYAVDMEQSLIAVLLIPKENELPKCYLLSTSSIAELHPLAARNPLVVETPDRIEGVQMEYSTITIIDDIVGVHMFADETAQLHVFNWKTGEFLWWSRNVQYTRQRDFLVSARHAIRVSTSHITLYDLTTDDNCYGPNRGLVCHLELPSLSGEPSNDPPRVYLQRPALASSGTSPHFESDPKHAVLMLMVQTDPPQSARESLIFIPISTILGYAGSMLRSSLPPSYGVPWDVWGAHGARLVLTAPHCRFVTPTAISGSRVVVFVNDGRPQSPHFATDALYLFDVRAAICKPSTHFEEGTADMLEISDHLIAPDIFKSPVHSTLPYRVVSKWCAELVKDVGWDIIQNVIYPLSDGLLHVGADYDEPA